jgi:hypothetical protein
MVADRGASTAPACRLCSPRPRGWRWLDDPAAEHTGADRRRRTPPGRNCARGFERDSAPSRCRPPRSAGTIQLPQPRSGIAEGIASSSATSPSRIESTLSMCLICVDTRAMQAGSLARQSR